MTDQINWGGEEVHLPGVLAVAGFARIIGLKEKG